jgi:hypothetical protein
MPLPSANAPRREDLSPGAFQRFKERILHSYFVRLDMTLILAVAVISGLGISKLLLEFGVRSLKLRYPIAVLASYGAFLLLIRVWIWYVFSRKNAASTGTRSALRNVDLDAVDVIGGGGDVAAEPVRFAGGDFGGSGASDVWEEPIKAAVAPTRCGSSGGKSGSFDLGDDAAVLLLVGLLVVAICCAGGYLVYVAPDILPEAAWQAALASAFARASKPTEHHDWLPCVLRTSAIPFIIVLILAGALGWVAHQHCPQAVKLAQVLPCAGR